MKRGWGSIPFLVASIVASQGAIAMYPYTPGPYTPPLPNPSITIPTNLFAYWTLNTANLTFGGSNTIADSSGNSRTGTMFNMTLAQNVPGQIRQALSFDGASRYLDRAGGGPQVLPFTGCLWVKPTVNTAGVVYAVLSNTNGLWDGWYLDFKVGGTININVAVGNTFYNSSATAVSTGVWTHICAVFTSSTSRQLYVNATPATLDTTSKAPSQSSYGISVGAADLGPGGINAYYSGLVDDVRTYSSALSGSDITSIYNAGLAGNP